MSEATKRELRAAFRNRGFVVVFAIMCVAALGLNGAVRAMNLHFRKERVELRKELELLPARLGPWLKVTDTQLSADVEHTLATKQYISRTYLDTRRLSPAEIASIEAAAGDARDRRVDELARRDPAAMIYLHVAYYTGMVDTVAHVPERCMVGGGFNPENPAVVALPVFAGVPGRSPGLNVKYTEYRNKAHPTQPKRNVAYFFQVNGTYEHDSIKGVRLRLQNIFERHGYYAKIELATFLGDDTKKAQATMADFLSFAMPEIEACLPDWRGLTGADAPLNRGQ
jgi:hypothetical protein